MWSVFYQIYNGYSFLSFLFASLCVSLCVCCNLIEKYTFKTHCAAKTQEKQCYKTVVFFVVGLVALMLMMTDVCYEASISFSLFSVM